MITSRHLRTCALGDDGELKNKMINEININKLNNNIEIFEILFSHGEQR